MAETALAKRCSRAEALCAIMLSQGCSALSIEVDDSISLGPWGGAGGNNWTHMANGYIKQIVIVHGLGIDSILFKNDNKGVVDYSKRFGGAGGTRTDKIEIDWPHEYLTTISGSCSNYTPNGAVVVRSPLIITNRTKYGPFGVETGTSFSLPMEGGVIVGFHGRSANFLDAIGVYVKPTSLALASSKHSPIVEAPSIEEDSNNIEITSVVKEVLPRGPGPWGGRGGKPWDDGVFSAIKQIYVCKGEDVIYSIQFEYHGRNQESVWSQKHGRSGGDTTNRIKLDFPTEFLICITGFHGPIDRNESFDSIRSLSFYTNKRKYGPFGDEIGIFFTSTLSKGKVVGFHGRSGVYLDAVGVHMEY
ncbi:hypothetical protein HHK36_033090 [Tetracentron sinense]|uniref:Jacalin-type lectin domain-containing protein n=1 Tax=Tetracentron sinense TaxID=13715 RepID=A0A834Y986_TETSI|nr:hypothetical protein HHK36_033090 [Tetracentron sinense]